MHLLGNMGDIPHAFLVPNPFDQAGVSSTGLGEMAHDLPSPNPIYQAGVSSIGLGEIAHVSPSPSPFDQGGAYSHSLERESPINGGVIQVEGSCHCFSLDAIRIATGDFDDAFVVGEGGFGKVYKSYTKMVLQ